MNKTKMNIVVILLIIVIAILNVFANHKAESTCNTKGGTFYKAVDVRHSLCKLNK